ncbi:MAG: hypothetical protein ACREPA_00055 [Candidatus Dormibacteraceae bacterium]
MRPVIIAAALAGAADTGLFLSRRPRLFREHPGRAAGAVAGLGVWLGLAASSARDTDTAGPRTVGLASLAALGSGALLASHLRHGVANGRILVGAGLAGLALGAATTSLASR